MVTEVPIRLRIDSQQVQQAAPRVVRDIGSIRTAAEVTNRQFARFRSGGERLTTTFGGLNTSIRTNASALNQSSQAFASMGRQSQRAARQATSGLNNIDRGARQSILSVQNLRNVLFALGGAVLLRRILGLANSYQNLENSIAVANAAGEGLTVTTGDILAIANRTRAPVEQLATVYQRGALASDELGASQRELLQLTETTAQAIAIQGGAAGSARGALLQFGQILGSTIVRSEEFNSLLEGALPLAQAAARGIDEAGGSVARLRILIAAGQITSQQFFQAILSQAPQIEQVFANLSPTISSAFTVLRNNAIALVGEANTGFNALASTILFVGDNLEIVANIAGVAGAALLAAFAPALVAAIGRATLAVTGLSAALTASPIGRIAVAISAAAAAVLLFSDNIAEALAPTVEEFESSLDAPIERLQVLELQFANSTAASDEFRESIARTLAETESLRRQEQAGHSVLREGFFGGARDLFEINNTRRRGLREAEDRAAESGLRGGVLGATRDLFDIRSAQRRGRPEDSPAAGVTAPEVEELESRIDELEAQGEEITQAETESREAESARRRRQFQSARRQVQESDPTDRIRDERGTLRGATDYRALVQAAEQQMEQIEQTEEAAQELDRGFERVLNSMERNLTDFLTTGRGDFSSFIDDIVSDLARLATQQLITEPLREGFSSILSDVFGGGGFADIFSGGSGGGGGGGVSSIYDFGGGGGFEGPSFQSGIDYVPRNMLAFLHRGERVVPARENQGSVNINLNLPNVMDYRTFRQNAGQISASLGRSIQENTRRNN